MKESGTDMQGVGEKKSNSLNAHLPGVSELVLSIFPGPMIWVGSVAVAHPSSAPRQLVEQLPHVVVLHGRVDGHELGVGVVVAAPGLGIAPAQFSLSDKVAEAGPKLPTLWTDLQKISNSHSLKLMKLQVIIDFTYILVHGLLKEV